MEFIQLKYFQAVAEAGKVSTAAKMMFVTPSAISSAINQLEQELGTPLFSRIGNRLKLNPQGDILLKHTDTILYHFGAAKAVAMESLPEGPMHVTVVATESHVLTDAITAFFAAHPDYTLTLNPTGRENMFRGAFTQRHAFLITTEADVPPSLVKECFHVRMFDVIPVCMMAKAHPLADRERIHIAELAEYPLIYPRSYPDYYSRISELYENLDFPMPQMRTYSQMVCRALVKQNDTIALTTTHSEMMDGDDYVSIPLVAPGICWEMHLFWRKKRELSEAESALLRFLSEYYGFAIPQL